MKVTDKPATGEVERVIARELPAMRGIWVAGEHFALPKDVLATIRATLRDHRLTPEQVGAAVGLRAGVVSDGDFVGAVLAVAPEDA